MASARKKSRQELISRGYCPNCSKFTAQYEVLQTYVLHECRKCGVLLLDASGRYEGPFVEITSQQWGQITDWYDKRRGELESQLLAELPGVVMGIVAGRNRLLSLVEN
jgi:hypothetical protein